MEQKEEKRKEFVVPLNSSDLYNLLMEESLKTRGVVVRLSMDRHELVTTLKGVMDFLEKVDDPEEEDFV